MDQPFALLDVSAIHKKYVDLALAVRPPRQFSHADKLTGVTMRASWRMADPQAYDAGGVDHLCGQHDMVWRLYDTQIIVVSAGRYRRTGVESDKAALRQPE